MKIITNICRILVGSLFIVSGLVKVVDPLGFSYKLEEYFQVFQATFGFGEVFMPFALFLSIFFSVLEIVLGFVTLAGIFPVLNAWLLLLLILFFTFLTGFSAVTGKVTDCGCFGDAIKLTPWESFYKDVVLLLLTGWIFIRRKTIQINTLKEDLAIFIPSFILVALFSLFVLDWAFPVYFTAGNMVVLGILNRYLTLSFKPHVMAAIPVLSSVALSLHCLYHLPIKDFRPYAVGKNIIEGMKSCEELGKPCPKYGVIYTMKNKSTGETIEITDVQYMNEKWWEKEDWEMLTGDEYIRSMLLEPGYEPPIHDFSIVTPEGEDVTFALLEQSRPVLFIIAYDLNKTCTKHFDALTKLVDACRKNGIDVVGLTASLPDEVESFKQKVTVNFPMYFTDPTTLKTIIRANPGLMLVQRATILGKWHIHDIPTVEELKNLTTQQ